MRFALPFPNVSALSLNARNHWAKRARLVKAARRVGWALAAEAFANAPVTPERPLPIKFTFHPPDKRNRNADNCITALKAYADGIADAIGVPDEQWRPEYAFAEQVKGGCVIVEIGGQS